MSSGKAIRTQISSIQSTQKITRAMEMVAASKMRKAQQRMQVGKPYAQRIRAVVGHIAGATPEYQHHYMIQREIRRVGFIIISTDRGLCGGLNAKLFKTATTAMKNYADQNIEMDLCLVGNKAASFFKRHGGRVIAAIHNLGEDPSVADLIGHLKVMLDAYRDGAIDKLYLIGNEFISTMTQTPTVQVLLPLPIKNTDTDKEQPKPRWDYIYEPDAKALLDGLLTRYVESQVYQAVAENAACEQAARMLAMKSATDNAGELIDGLQLVYNKARQAAITQELSEIVGGAAAVS